MEILIENNYEGKLIREVLRGELGYSANLIKKLKFSEGGILVNGQWVTVRYELKRGDVLSLAVEDGPEDVSPYILPAELPLEVLFEDEWITAVNKPPNMPAHPSLGHRMDTAANALAFRYSPRGERPYVFRPVNRLDRDTSGCMLTSNSRAASYKMYSAMVSGQIHKQYLAVTDGVPAEKTGTLRSFLRRREDSIVEREECSGDAPGAKEAVTSYRVLDEAAGRALLLASPITGRTHQLRVQFAGIGCPITGDTLYGQESPEIARHALHSWRTSFPHPGTGEGMTLTAPVPADLAALANAFGLRLPNENLPWEEMQ